MCIPVAPGFSGFPRAAMALTRLSTPAVHPCLPTGVSQLCFLGVSQTLALVLEPDVEAPAPRSPWGGGSVRGPLLPLLCCAVFLPSFPLSN